MNLTGPVFYPSFLFEVNLMSRIETSEYFGIAIRKSRSEVHISTLQVNFDSKCKL